MSISKNVLALILILGFFTSCQDDDANNEMEVELNFNCETNDSTINEAEQSLIAECTENNLSSKSEMENALLGEWELIAHGCSIFSEDPQPCINLTFSNDELILVFKDEFQEQTDTFSWEVIEINSSPILEITPSTSLLPIRSICNEYIHGFNLGLTGTSAKEYLYQKVE